MDPTTFDRITKLFARRRLSRRQAVTGSASLAATALAATGLPAQAAASTPGGPAPALTPAPASTTAMAKTFAVLAQPAPGATAIAPPTTTGGAKPTSFLFLQSFERGSLIPKPGSPGHYLLTLHQGLGDTVYFSDRPAKVVGTVPTERFLGALGFTPANPPNAALVGQRDATHKDIVVVELFNPHYDAASTTLTYEVTLLADWHTLDETFEQTPDDAAHLPRDFTAAHLFIDDCPDMTRCYLGSRIGPPVGPMPGGPVGLCWQWTTAVLFWECRPCNNEDWTPYNERCNRAYPEECGREAHGCYAGS